MQNNERIYFDSNTILIVSIILVINILFRFFNFSTINYNPINIFHILSSIIIILSIVVLIIAMVISKQNEKYIIIPFLGFILALLFKVLGILIIYSKYNIHINSSIILFFGVVILELIIYISCILWILKIFREKIIILILISLIIIFIVISKINELRFITLNRFIYLLFSLFGDFSLFGSLFIIVAMSKRDVFEKQVKTDYQNQRLLTTSQINLLNNLASLRNAGLISDEEFFEKKNEIINRY